MTQTTSPDNIPSPDLSDQYALTQDMANLADGAQLALIKRANMYVGTSAQRTAFTSAPEGVHWQDTNGTKREYVRQSGSWVDKDFDTGWVDCTVAPGITLQGGQPPRVRRIGNLVSLRWGVASNGFSPNSAKDAFTIPNGFRSDSSRYFPIASSGADNTTVSEVRSNGTVSVRTGVSVGAYFMWDSVSYMV